MGAFNMKRYQIDPVSKVNKSFCNNLLSDELRAISKAFKNNDGGDIIISSAYRDDWDKRIKDCLDLAITMEAVVNDTRAADDVLLAALHDPNSNVVLLGGEE